MTEIQPYAQPAEVVLMDSQDKAVRRLTEWAQSAAAAHNIATTLVQTTFVPDGVKGKPGEATAAILAGLEVGLQPMAALRAFDVIQGQAAPRALTLRAIVQSFGHEMVLEESTATRCRMRGRRKGSSEWVPVTWTIDRAKDLGLTGKHNWKAQPQAMLVARATSELARLIAADAILGLGYSAEEVADGGPVERTTTDTVDSTPTPTRRMSRKKAEPSQEDLEALRRKLEQPSDIEDAEEVEEPETGEAITPAQMKMLHASFNEANIADRDTRLNYCRNLIDRDIDSSKDLTKAEASRIIDALVQDAEAGA